MKLDASYQDSYFQLYDLAIAIEKAKVYLLEYTSPCEIMRTIFTTTTFLVLGKINI